MITRITQESLFPYNTNEILNELSVSLAAATQLFEGGFLSFDPAEIEELNALEYYELYFVCRLFNSGLSSESVKTLLSKLDKPYCYDITKVYYAFKNKEWEMIPIPEEPSIEELIDNIIEDEDHERLKEIYNWITKIIEENK